MALPASSILLEVLNGLFHNMLQNAVAHAEVTGGHNRPQPSKFEGLV